VTFITLDCNRTTVSYILTIFQCTRENWREFCDERWQPSIYKLSLWILVVFHIKYYTYFFLQYISILINNNLGIFQNWDGQWSHLLQTIVYFKWLRSLKNEFYCRVSPISTRLFCYKTCIFYTHESPVI